MKLIIFLIIVILGIGTGAYFTLERSRDFQAAQDLRLEHKKNKETHLSNWADTVERNKGHEAVKSDRLDRSAVLKANIASMKTKETQMRAAISQADQVIAKYEARLESIRTKTDAIQADLAKIDANLDISNLPDRVNEAQDTKEQAVEALNELEVLLASAEKALAENKVELARMNEREDQRMARVRTGSMEIEIIGVKHDWGFLVIGAGSDDGFAPQGSLIVERNGRMLGRVRPSSIEKNQTIAEINYDTLPPGVRIQPGDKVIFPVASSN